jgi:acylphosphatase
MPVACKHVHYSGEVQGVGFRYTARSLAQGFPIAGYVRNLADGRVELMAEGEAVEVERFLEALARRMSEYIASRDVAVVAAQGFSGFVVR